MSFQRIACFTVLLMGVTATLSESASAQYFGKGFGSGISGVGAFNRSNLGSFAKSNFGNNGFADRGFKGRGGFRGNANIIPPPSFHEFARTIPRPYENSILPFYALYPPVYYSYVVPRPYGFSPFALPAGKAPAEAIVGPAKPAEVVNPFYRPDGGAEEIQPQQETGFKSASVINRHVRQPQAASQPQSDSDRSSKLIINPFVKQPKVAAQYTTRQR